MRLQTFSEEDDMSGMKRNVVLALAVAAAVAAPGAFATTGYFSHGYSMKEKGMGGTGVAFAQDSLASANNPAGLVNVGNRMDVGVALFSPIRSYTTSDPVAGDEFPGCGPACPAQPLSGSVDSDNELFLIPSFGRNWMLDANSAIGFAVYANGGMNTKYNAADTGPTAPGTYSANAFGLGDGTAGVDLAQLFFNLSYAQKFGTSASWGASAIVAYQKFKAYGLEAFNAFGVSTDGSNLTNNGYDDATGFGLKFGVQGEVSPGLTLGAQYQTEIDMSEFDKYKGLFAEQGDFDVPATATIGLAWKASPTSVLTFDIQKIWYSKVASVGNPLMPAFNSCFATVMGGGSAASDPNCLGGNSGPGFGWNDINIYRLGYQWTSGPDWTWRVGYINNDNPIESSEVLFNILAPGVQEQHVTFGFTKQMGKTNDLTFAAMYSPESDVSGSGPTVNPLNQSQNIEIKMKQYELGVAWGWKF
jgi:long-chain fatty acid transport protein